ncbi:precorrin-2 C(20)-methyltransferase [Candidatus Thiosymbion oneisti]|uniref:precorrin-2 C(20)-methyltransferase n=1 Tax=Candidatus Thiosymbion oneisti TaxID=589554 RepID=UPI000AFA8224|nr:precorrin-2 C(20)-methyltransferase [Candidatus Thiosymbion oneisti]
MIDKGILYGISLGPGDPGLITRRAWALLEQDDVHWTYPVRGKGHQSFALSITRAAGLRPPSGCEPLVFPMTHDQARLAAAWSAAAQRVGEILRQGRDVLFLVEGDASIYSSFGYLARTLTALDPDTRVETVAGVSSFSASAARLQMPLTDLDDRMAILPAGYGTDTVDHLLDEFDTLVLLKVKPLLDDIIDLLARRRLLEHAVFCEKTGTPEERIVRDLNSLRGTSVNYLSLLLVKNPDRVGGR